MYISYEYKILCFLFLIKPILYVVISKQKPKQFAIKQFNAHFHFCHSLYIYILTSLGRSALALFGIFNPFKNVSEVV